jgi:hypothetical protein
LFLQPASCVLHGEIKSDLNAPVVLTLDTYSHVLPSL